MYVSDPDTVWLNANPVQIQAGEGNDNAPAYQKVRVSPFIELIRVEQGDNHLKLFLHQPVVASVYKSIHKITNFRLDSTVLIDKTKGGKVGKIDLLVRGVGYIDGIARTTRVADHMILCECYTFSQY